MQDHVFFSRSESVGPRRNKRKATNQSSKIWPSNTVPYEISNDFSEDINYYHDVKNIIIESFLLTHFANIM